MKRSTLLASQAALVVASHIALIFWVVIEQRSLTGEEFSATLGIVLPLFGSYLVAVVQYYVKHPEAVGSFDTVNGAYATISLVLPGALVAFVLMVIALQLYGDVFRTSEDYVKTLTLAETAFGVYVGRLISSSFGKVERPPETVVDAPKVAAARP
jgi:hypothetical protein